MSTVQIEGLWQFIKTLNLSARNKQWLAERLIEPDVDTNKQNFLSEISLAAQEAKDIADGKKQGINAYELMNYHIA